MAPGTEGGTSWLDDLKELILKKKEESAALKKVSESLQTLGFKKDTDNQKNIEESSPEGQENFTLNNQNPNINP